MAPSTMLQRFLLPVRRRDLDRTSFGAIGAEGQHFLRLSIAASLERLHEGAARIAKAVDDRDGFRSFLEEERLLAAPTDVSR